MKAKETYEHVNPALVGNETRVLVSDQSGVSNINFKAKDFGVGTPQPQVAAGCAGEFEPWNFRGAALGTLEIGTK